MLLTTFEIFPWIGLVLIIVRYLAPNQNEISNLLGIMLTFILFTMFVAVLIENFDNILFIDSLNEIKKELGRRYRG